MTDSDRKKAFDRLFKALWITFRSGSDIGSEAFRVAEANYYRLTRIETKDFEAFFARLDESFPSPAEFQAKMAEFISAKYPRPARPPEPSGPVPITPAGRALVKIMARRYPVIEDYRPDLNLLRATLFDIAFKRIGQKLDSFWSQKLEAASPADKEKVNEYISKANLIRELGL